LPRPPVERVCGEVLDADEVPIERLAGADGDGWGQNGAPMQQGGLPMQLSPEQKRWIAAYQRRQDALSERLRRKFEGRRI